MTTLQFTVYVFPLAAAAVIMGALAIIAFKNRTVPGAWQVALFLAAACVWSAAYAAEVLFADLPNNLLCTDIEYFGIVTVPVAWLLFVLYYTGRDHIVNRKTIVMLFLIPVFTLFFVFTNDYHHLFYTAVVPKSAGETVIWVFSYGPLFWIHYLYSYLLILGGISLMAGKYLISPPAFRRQIVLILIALSVPIIANIVYVLHTGPFNGFDMTPVAFVFTGAALVVATARYQLFSLMPFAQSMLVDHMQDGVVVVNDLNHVVAINPSALGIAGLSGDKSAVGKGLDEIFPDLCSLTVPGIWECSKEVGIPSGRKTRYFEVQRLPLPYGDGRIIGHLIILKNITELRVTANALREANMKLNLLNDITRHDIRNRLTILLFYLDAARGTKEPDELRQIIAKMGDTVQAIRDQIDFTKNYQDLGMKLPEWQDVKDVVNRVLPQIDREDIRIDCTLDGVEIYADPLLERVMYNLIENAVLYGKTLTAITISGQEVQDGFIIMVKDNGVGIPAAEKEKIFYRGFGTNAGLGLFLAREILGITGITITETGAPGKGARFELLVPKDEYRFVRQ